MLAQIEAGKVANCIVKDLSRLGRNSAMTGLYTTLTFPKYGTRFIAINRHMFIPEGANKISLCFSLPHRTGTLHSVLARFATAGLNLTKIESRPIPGKTFEYDFYLDFTGNAQEPHTLNLIAALSDELPRFSFLGNYREQE